MTIPGIGLGPLSRGRKEEREGRDRDRLARETNSSLNPRSSALARRLTSTQSARRSVVSRWSNPLQRNSAHAKQQTNKHMNITTVKRADLKRLSIFAVLILGSIGPLFIGSASAQTKTTFVTPPAGFTRIQLKHGGQFLDAAFCGKTITLNPGSTYEGGACQQWTMVPAGGGYYRIQLKHGDQILDAAFCGKTITLNAGSTFEGGA